MRVNMVNVVRGFITAKPSLANDDIDLMYAIWAWQLKNLKPSMNINSMSAKQLMKIWKDKKIASPFNISRSRRKCQEHYPETRGENYGTRQRHQKQIKEDVKRSVISPDNRIS